MRACFLFVFCRVCISVPLLFPPCPPDAGIFFLVFVFRQCSSYLLLVTTYVLLAAFLILHHIIQIFFFFFFLFRPSVGIFFLVLVLFRPCSTYLFLFSPCVFFSAFLILLHHILKKSCWLFLSLSLIVFLLFSGLAYFVVFSYQLL